MRRTVLAGVVGAVLVLIGGSWYQALATPPYRYIDEQAHVGYVLSVQSGRLPTVDTPIDGAAGGTALRQRLTLEPPRRRDVWVANNPPLTYLVAAGPSALTRALGLRGGPLLGLRLVNVAAAAGAVALAYLLGRDLAGGDRRVGLTTAGLVALLPHMGFVAALAFNDGMAALTTTGVLWSLTRVLTPRPPNPDKPPTPSECAVSASGSCRSGTWRTRLRDPFLVLGLWCAAAALVRPMAMVTAVAAALLGLALGSARGTWWSIALRLFAPMTVLAAWYYVLNITRYGDPTGSSELLDKFLRQPTRSFFDTVRDNTIWESAFRTITTRRTDLGLPGDPVVWFRVAELVFVLGVIGTVVLLMASAGRTRWLAAGVIERAGALPGRAWLAVTLVALVPVLLTAQHTSEGGNPHPRYLLPVLAVLAAAVALPLIGFAGRWAAIALLSAMAVLTAVQTRASVRDLASRPGGPVGSELVRAYGPTVVRGLGPLLAVGGLVLLAVALARLPIGHLRLREALPGYGRQDGEGHLPVGLDIRHRPA